MRGSGNKPQPAGNNMARSVRLNELPAPVQYGIHSDESGNPPVPACGRERTGHPADRFFNKPQAAGHGK